MVSASSARSCHPDVTVLGVRHGLEPDGLVDLRVGHLFVRRPGTCALGRSVRLRARGLLSGKVLNTSSRSADTTSFRYNDGSYGTITKTGQSVQYDFFDLANFAWSRSYFDGSVSSTTPSTPYGDKDRNCPCTTTVSNDFSNGVMQTADYKAWNASAQPIASQSGITPPASFLAENQRIAVDIQYHLGLFGY